jgi:hypothetical protein
LFAAGEQRDAPTGSQGALQADGRADVAGIVVAAGLLDVRPDRIEFATQLLDVGLVEMRVTLNVGDGHDFS